MVDFLHATGHHEGFFICPADGTEVKDDFSECEHCIQECPNAGE